MKLIWDSGNEQILKEMWGKYNPVDIAKAINKRQDELGKKFITTETGVFYKAVQLGLATTKAYERYCEYRYREKIPVTCETCGRKWMTVSRINPICPVCRITRRWRE